MHVAKNKALSQLILLI